MLPKLVPQADDDAALGFDESPFSTQGVTIAITHGIGGFLQLAVILCRDSVNRCLLGLRLGESTSKSSGFEISRLDFHMQAKDNQFRRSKSVAN